MDALAQYLEQTGVYGLALLAVTGGLSGYTSIRIFTGWHALRAARADLQDRITTPHWPVAQRLITAARQAGSQALNRTIQVETRRLKSGLHLISALTTTAPLLGLLGTVQGMAQAFFALALAGGRTNMANLADGIRLALFTTLTGLLVAMAGLFCHALVQLLCKAEEKTLRSLSTRLFAEVCHE